MSDLEMYLEFRKEIDTMFFPKFKRNNIFLPLTNKDENIGFMIVEKEYDYIDALWIAPEYRGKGYGTKLVYHYITTYGMPRELRILNNNKVAYQFWNSIFKLRSLEDNGYDNLYLIEGLNNDYKTVS